MPNGKRLEYKKLKFQLEEMITKKNCAGKSQVTWLKEGDTS